MATKQEYLANRMIDGARALSELFNWLKTNRAPLTDNLVEEITKSCEITKNQANYLHKTVERAKRAQGIIKYLENRFGVNENLDFQDSEGLYRLLFRNKSCPKKIQAKSHNIGIGLTRQNWRYKNSVGRAGIGFWYDQLNSPLDKTIQRLEAEKMTNVGDLCFTLPSKDYFVKAVEKRRSELNEQGKILLAIFGPSVEQEAERWYGETEKHELRHVIDEILPSHGKRYIETQADLISEGNFRGLNRDINAIKERIEKNIKKNLENFEYFEKSWQAEELKFMVEKEREFYDASLKRKENLDKGVEILKELVKKFPKQDYEILSYAFSTLPYLCSNRSLNHLRLLDVYYKNKANKQEK
ncbi:MAG: hypothetical protein PHH54_06400 [Candidatus Nanoarchaeia archaeon]|nr:hypothetical protein [Candidatus Nanoarchaeia archaeon]